MAEVILSPAALEDLKGIHDYISQHSPFYANKVVHTLLDRITDLQTNIKLGRVVPEFEQSHIREIFEYRYRIIYRIESEQLISIARILHQAKNLIAL